jgi:hypothetical protein
LFLGLKTVIEEMNVFVPVEEGECAGMEISGGFGGGIEEAVSIVFRDKEGGRTGPQRLSDC